MSGNRLLAARCAAWEEADGVERKLQEEANGVERKLQVDQSIPTTNHSRRQIWELTGCKWTVLRSSEEANKLSRKEYFPLLSAFPYSEPRSQRYRSLVRLPVNLFA